MLQQAASRLLLLNRIGLQQVAAAAAAGTSSCLQQQQHPFSQQWRGKSSSSEGPFSEAAGAQQTSSGWSWFGSSQSAAASQPNVELPPVSTAAAAGAADAAVSSEAAAAMAATPEAGMSAVESLSDQADLLMQVSSAAAEATAAAARAECWLGTRYFMDLMFWVHDNSWLSLPWCEAILVANLFFKVCALPMTIIQQKNIPAMAIMRQDTEVLKEFSTKMAKAATAADYGAYAVQFKQAQAEFHRKHASKKKYLFLGPALAIGQAVVFISQFSAIGTLANAKLPSMTYEGAMWFTNLTIPDPWFALPIICGAATFLQFNSKRFKDQMLAQGGNAAGPMQKIMPLMGGFILIAGCFQPSAIALLWASNSVISISQNYLMWHPKFRAYVGLPPMTALTASTSNSSQSFADLWKKATGAVDQQQQKQQPKPAEAAGAPPPGRLAVNYVSSKPRSRKPRS